MTSGISQPNRANSRLVTTPRTRCPAQPRSRVRTRRPIRAMPDHLASIVRIAADDRPRESARIDSHPAPSRFHHRQHIAASGQEAVPGPGV